MDQQTTAMVKRLRIAHLRLMIPFAVIAWWATQPIGDNSFLWHVRAGTAQLDAGRVLTSDPFSFTAAGETWRTQSWLAELGYGWLERASGGLGWVPTMKFLGISAVIALLALVVHKVGGGRPAVVLGGMLVLLWQGIPYGVARPALLGALMLAVVVAVTYMDRRPLWLLPPLFWLWASVHGMFVVGLGYLFLDALRRKSRQQVGAVAAAGLATALTAHGLGTWWVLLQFTRSRGALGLISEWGPPVFSDPLNLPFLFVIVGLLVVGSKGRLMSADLWIAIPFLSFGLLAERNVWPAVIVLAPLAARAWDRPTAPTRKARDESIVINWVIAAALVTLAVLGLARPAELSEERFPAAAAVAALDSGPTFTGSAVGGYLIYSEWPDRRVFIDDRAELYGEEGFQRFLNLQRGIDVEKVFTDLGIEQVLAKAEWPIVESLRVLGWEYRYQDEHFVVMGQP